MRHDPNGPCDWCGRTSIGTMGRFRACPTHLSDLLAGLEPEGAPGDPALDAVAPVIIVSGHPVVGILIEKG